MKSLVAIILFLLLSLASHAQQLQLGWTPIAESWVDHYLILAGTNSGVTLSNAAVRLNAGTATNLWVDGLKPGMSYFVAHAVATNGTVNPPSRELAVFVPATTNRMFTVIAQWSGQVASTNWQDVGYFRVKLGP